MKPLVVLIKGGGDLGSGVAYSLHRVGMCVLITELPQPLVIRRAVSYASAIYQGTATVEGVTAERVADLQGIEAAWAAGRIAVLADPRAEIARQLKPDVVVDATLAKRPDYTRLDEASLVIGLGPGFVAGQHVHAVIETMRGHNLGRIITAGAAQPDTGIPDAVLGYTWERVLRAPAAGVFRAQSAIGEHVEAGQAVARVDEAPVVARIGGVLRGLLWDGLPVRPGQKVGDVDPRDVREHCFTISDKSRAVGRAVLEAILTLRGPGAK